MRPALDLRMHSTLLGWLVLLVAAPSAAFAQDDDPEPPTTAVLQTDAAHPDDRGLAGAVERVMRARLDGLGVVDVAGTPALSLEDLQLAVGCVGDTPTCLKAVTEQLDVDALLISRIDRAGGARVLTITFYDASAGERESVVRRVEGPRAQNELLDGVDGQVRELFGLPAPKEPEAPTYGPGEGEGDEVDEPGLPLTPFLVAGAGVAALAAGAAVGVKAQDNEDAYAAIEPATADDADRAQALFAKADRQAKIAYALMGVGGGLVAGGVVLFFLMRDNGRQEQGSVALSPIVGPTMAGLSLAGRFGGAR